MKHLNYNGTTFPDYDAVIKTVVVGNSGVGKSSVLLRYVDDRFSESYITTIGVDFMLKYVQTSEGRVVRLQLWDTAGQERFRNIVHAYFRGAHAILFAYSITDRESFNAIESWVEDVARYSDSLLPNSFLIGTKCDLEAERCVQTHEGEQLAQRLKMPFLETSAKTSHNVELVFEHIAERFMLEFDQRRLQQKDEELVNLRQPTTKLSTSNNKTSYICCNI